MTHTAEYRPTERAIVVTYYRGDYTSYERDVRLAKAVKDKYTQPQEGTPNPEEEEEET